MFGYVNIYKNELKIKDYNLFRAYYCGLCKSLGKMYNQAVRLGLSYDMTFLAIIADSLDDAEPVLKKEGCIKHIGSHAVCSNNKYIDYSADASIILSYHKLTDDINDDKSVRAYLARMAYVRAVRKAGSKHPELSEVVKSRLSELSELEEGGCASVDMAAHPFAGLTEEIFRTANPSLAAIGYNIGRFIYIIDALNDIDSDIKSKSYNPYLCAYGKDAVGTDDFIKMARGSINMTLSAISHEYESLHILKNKAVTDNIIYMGLRFAADKVFKKMEEKND